MAVCPGRKVVLGPEGNDGMVMVRATSRLETGVVRTSAPPIPKAGWWGRPGHAEQRRSIPNDLLHDRLVHPEPVARSGFDRFSYALRHFGSSTTLPGSTMQIFRRTGHHLIPSTRARSLRWSRTWSGSPPSYQRLLGVPGAKAAAGLFVFQFFPCEIIFKDGTEAFVLGSKTVCWNT